MAALSRISLLAALSLAAPGLAASPALAAAPAAEAPAAAPAAPAHNWTPSCRGAGRSADLACVISESVIVKNTGQAILTLTVAVPGHGKPPTMTLRLPVGLYIPGGVKIAVDGGAATEVPLQTCEANGCFAAAQLPSSLLAAMKRGKQVSVNMQDMAKKPVSLTLPLEGFAASWAQIE